MEGEVFKLKTIKELSTVRTMNRKKLEKLVLSGHSPHFTFEEKILTEFALISALNDWMAFLNHNPHHPLMNSAVFIRHMMGEGSDEELDEQIDNLIDCTEVLSDPYDKEPDEDSDLVDK